MLRVCETKATSSAGVLLTRFGAARSAGSEGTGDGDPLTSPKKGWFEVSINPNATAAGNTLMDNVVGIGAASVVPAALPLLAGGLGLLGFLG